MAKTARAPAEGEFIIRDAAIDVAFLVSRRRQLRMS